MINAIRLCTSDSLLAALPEGYVTLASLLGGRQPDVTEECLPPRLPPRLPPQAERGAQDGDAAGQPLASAIGRLVDAYLGTVPVGAGATAKVSIQLASKTFVPSESQQMIAALCAIRETFAPRLAACELDVFLFVHNLFSAVRADAAPREATRASLRELQGRLSELQGIAPRVWLLDGQASNGVLFTIDDIAGVVRLFDSQWVPDALATQGDKNAFFSFGARVVWFPRSRVLNYLGKRFALRVLENETWIDGALLPKVSVAHECTRFIEEDLVPVVGDMRLDEPSRQDFTPVVGEMELDEQNRPLIPQVECPALDADAPDADRPEKIRNTVDDLKARKLDGIQRAFDANAKRAVVDLKKALANRIHRQIDENDARVVMGQAFLEVLLTSSSALVEGDPIDTGKPRTLRQAFAKAYDFFDRLTVFDPAARKRASDLKEGLDEKRQSIQIMDREIALVEKRLDAGEDGAAAEREVLEAERKRVEAELTQNSEQFDAAIAVVRTQDEKIKHSRDELRKSLEQEIDTEVSARLEAVEKSGREVDEARASLGSANARFRDAVLAIILRVVGLVFGVFLVGFLGLLLLPAIFGAAPVVGPPLFGFVGTVVGVQFVKIWGIVALVTVFVYVVYQARKYFKEKQKIDALTRELAKCRSSLETALREYWKAYRKHFYSFCDWARFSSVFTLNLELEEEADKLRGRLDAFLEGLRAACSEVEQETQAFSLESTRTELVVVDRAHVDRLLDMAGPSVERHAADFFKGQDRHLSVFFDTGADAMVAAIGAYCDKDMAETFASIRGGSVVSVIDETGYDLKKDTAAVPLFLPLGRAAEKKKPVLVLVGPDGDWLKERLGGMAPAPIIFVSPDAERILVLRVAYDIDLGTLPW